MYFIPIIALALVIVIGSVWSPVFALVIAVPLFLLFLGYVSLSRRADQKMPAPSGEPASGEGEAGRTGGGGIWGEK